MTIISDLASRVAATAMLISLLGSMAFAAEAEKEGKEETVTEDQLPAAVKATLTKELNGAKATELEKETKDGKVVYCAELPGTEKGTVIELTIAEDGKLISRETEKEDDDANEADEKK
jgi:HSP20 family molecular chaperone IbpA